MAGQLVLKGRYIRLSNDVALVGELLAQLLSHSPYTYFLSRHVDRVGVRVDGVTMLVALDAQSGEVSLQVCDDHVRPVFWVACSFSSLKSAVDQGHGVNDLTIRTGPMGQVVHPRVEQILLRCFQASPFPIDDREELIYPALFGFSPPRIVWQSQRNLLRVLHYVASNGVSFCVSSGLSEPWAWQPAEIYDEKVSGAGYELVVKTSESAVIDEFSSWVQYIEQSGAHLLPGNWLEYKEGKKIPGTNIAGFLVVRPTTFIDHFPVGELTAHWHSLVPASPTQLDLAKRTDVFQVARLVEAEASS
jgi:hypothetical protein